MHAARNSSHRPRIADLRAAFARQCTTAWRPGLAFFLAACAGSAGPPALPDAPALRRGELRVRLVFGGEADLDLYVTGPGQETVYFANTPAAGGSLDSDRRCEDPAPRVETVSFAGAPAGLYRVGIDFPVRCGREDRAAYRLVLEAGAHREERSGELELGRFEPRALEIEITP